MRLLAVWLLNTLALLAVAYLMPSVRIESFGAALAGALLLGLANAVVRPILILLTLPVTVLTLGLFILVINGAVFLGVSRLVSGFEVPGLWPAVLAAILFSIVSWFLSALILRE
ncbi:MAG TPA: phage holin family protein [Burkholderiales bacterium]|nr:phage holin family protein [Burkholderiales bacterium]